ncbi:BCL2/adenovirus E1B 19 kDa protein-interacting protein 3-like [Ptychodera flava]|uniref:BCL2/adenovirus E1B 19 kDa protein-interacting protein 3-like n=1 Tax=Ptychodera flava TaxID=63121 RepID=UPI00396A2E09
MANQPLTEQEDALNESWVELHYAQGGPGQHESTHSGVPLSAYNGNMEKLLMEAQRESSRSTSRGSSQGGSPKTPNSPISSAAGSTTGSSFGHAEQPQIQLGIAQGMVDNTSSGDWIWDWSSRPESHPPKEFKFKHPDRKSTLSMRKSKAMKSGIFSTEFLSVFIPSLILSHLLTLGVGIYIGARLASNKTS